MAIFLPVEIITRSVSGTGLLEMITGPIAAFFVAAEGAAMDANVQDYNFIKPATKAVINLFYKAGKGALILAS